VVRNEVRAIKKLCDGTHENLIHVFGIGELSESALVFIDMELCAFNLKEYNKSNWTYDIAYGYSPDLIADRIWRIMQQIAKGLVFIHNHGEVHRDIKPQNGRLLDARILIC
jgi:serine/threonine protein kinase